MNNLVAAIVAVRLEAFADCAGQVCRRPRRARWLAGLRGLLASGRLLQLSNSWDAPL